MALPGRALHGEREMPMYEYRCETCGEEFTLMRPMAERDKAPDCPECGGSETKRGLSAFSTTGGDSAGGAGGGCGPSSGFG